MDSDDSDSDDSIFGRVLYRGVHSDSEDESSDEESIGSSSSEAEEEYNEERWLADLQKVKDDYPGMTQLFGDGVYNHMGGMTGRQWEEIGRDISKNTHLQEFSLTDGALDDDTMSFFSRGLTRSSSIRNINLHHNPLTAAGVRSMVPFLQNAPYLKCLELDRNNLQSEGFNTLWRTLFDSPIEKLDCQRCGIESIEIDSNRIPKNLRNLRLCKNALNAEGCRALVKLLYRGDSTLTDLHLNENKIDDEGVEILVDALQNNTSLETLALSGNYGISKRGKTMLLKLVNDISSIEATLRSNHILRYIFLNDWMNCEIQKSIDMITKINRQGRNSEEAGRSKIIETQLHSGGELAF